MKTVSKITSVIVMLVMNANSQVKTKQNGGGAAPATSVSYVQSNSNRMEVKYNGGTDQSSKGVSFSGNDDWIAGYGLNESLILPMESANYNSNYFNHAYSSGKNSVKKSAKFALRSAGVMINEAVKHHQMAGIYAPLLAKAIMHYHYACDLYRWGNYYAVINHSERSQYLTWYSMQCLIHSGNLNENIGSVFNQPDPYCDPFNPYYKKAGSDNSGNCNPLNNKDYTLKLENIDEDLPDFKMNDQELIRSFNKSSIKEE